MTPWVALVRAPHRAGWLGEAEQAYELQLVMDADNADALANLGTLCPQVRAGTLSTASRNSCIMSSSIAIHGST